MACRDFAYQPIKTSLFIIIFIPFFLLLSTKNFPRLPIHEFFSSSSQYSLPNHHHTTFLSQIHQSKPPSNHNHSKPSQTSQNFPFTIFLNHKWPPTKETLAQRKPPTPSHPQAKPNTLVPHPNHPKTPSISSMTKPKSSTKP